MKMNGAHLSKFSANTHLRYISTLHICVYTEKRINQLDFGPASAIDEKKKRERKESIYI